MKYIVAISHSESIDIMDTYMYTYMYMYDVLVQYVHVDVHVQVKYKYMTGLLMKVVVNE